MTRDVARATLYRGAINLWVEDEVTRSYLSEIWNDSRIAYFIGGGNEGVRAIVADAEKAGYPNVFALVDRDFQMSNRPHWRDPSKTFRKFILPVHEIENHLLDPEALADSRFNNLKRTAADIDNIMKKRAHELCWWATCREVVAELRRRFREDFLQDPKSPPVDSLEQALKHICDSPWFKNLPVEVARTTEPNIQELLSAAHERAETWLDDGTWRAEFAGKEILRHAASHFFDRMKPPGYAGKASELDTDLAKEVASWQVRNKRIPEDLVDLREALLERIARTSAPGRT